MDDDVRRRVFIHSPDAVKIYKVVFREICYCYMLIAFVTEFFEKMFPQESFAASDGNLFIFQFSYLKNRSQCY
jgi:hypothetical protein